MRKVTTPNKICGDCGSILIHEKYENFCDHCQDKITEDPLQLTVFWENSNTDADSYEFCSWLCVLDWLKNTTLNKKMMTFISLPYLGGGGKDFIEEYGEFWAAMETLVEEDKE